ncbi:IS3 family transposase [Corynebacterium diphtheriae]|uniref:IS3 family transposase n=1 Tax=Corynebacterium diphtheriae TaxID=1717 RepID=UPI003CC7D2F4
MAELLWSTLKTEFYNRRRFATRDEAKKAVAWWIEVIYNRKRRHSALGMQSPVAFENQINHHNQKSTAA